MLQWLKDWLIGLRKKNTSKHLQKDKGTVVLMLVNTFYNTFILLRRSHYKSVQKDLIKEKAFPKHFLLTSTDTPQHDSKSHKNEEENIVS